MLPETRRLQILDRLTRTTGQAVTVAELSRELAVSEMTLRRDLGWLAERGIVTRVHGGVLLYLYNETEKPFRERLMDFNRKKIDRMGYRSAGEDRPTECYPYPRHG